MEELKQQVAELIAEAHRLTNATRTRIKLFIAVLVLITVALAGFGSTALQARSAARKAAAAAIQAKAALVASCESGNDFRRQDLILWTHLLALPPRSGESITQRRQREQQSRQFRAFITAHDKLRACKK